MSRVVVDRTEPSGLERRVWVFQVLDFPNVHLEFFAEESRKTRRHKWVRSGSMYSRLKVNRYALGTWLTEEPEVPEDVLEEMLSEMRAQLEFKKWRGR